MEGRPTYLAGQQGNAASAWHRIQSSRETRVTDSLEDTVDEIEVHRTHQAGLKLGDLVKGTVPERDLACGYSRLLAVAGQEASPACPPVGAAGPRRPLQHVPYRSP